jgi:hypothetical protein
MPVNAQAPPDMEGLAAGKETKQMAYLISPNKIK